MRRITIKKSITITAPAEKVWQVLFGEKSDYEAWAKEFSEGATVEGSWDIDSAVVMKDKGGNGMIARVVKYTKNEVLVMEYEGVLIDGEKLYSGPAAEAMNGGMESYMLESSGSTTYLHIESDVGEDFVEQTSAAWDRALETIRTLAENK